MSLIAQATNSVFGRIEPPAPVQNTYGALGDGNAGLTGFISDIIIFITIVGGLWFLVNVVIGGLKLITSEGDSKKLSEFGTRLSMMVVGLILMVGAPLIAAIIGFMVFGDATALLNPTIVGIGR
jgi:hypothetical protein